MPSYTEKDLQPLFFITHVAFKLKSNNFFVRMHTQNEHLWAAFTGFLFSLVQSHRAMGLYALCFELLLDVTISLAELWKIDYQKKSFLFF